MTDEERVLKSTGAGRLLRAMTGVNHIYIEEASQFAKAGMAESPGGNAQIPALNKRQNLRNLKIRQRVRRIRTWAGIAAAAAACFALVTVGVRTARLNSEHSADTPESGYDAAANPYQEVGSLSEAEAIAGFDFEIPQAEKPFDRIVFNVIDGNTIEADYYTQDESHQGYSIRKAKGNEDISGDYNQYSETDTEDVNGISVTLKGDGDTWSLATWTSGGYSYSVSISDSALSKEQILEIVQRVR